MRDAGTMACSRSALIALRMRVRKSATGSFNSGSGLYQEDFVMPGIIP